MTELSPSLHSANLQNTDSVIIHSIHTDESDTDELTYLNNLPLLLDLSHYRPL